MFIYSLINLVETAIYVFISLVLVGAIVNFILSYLKVSTGYSELQNFLIVLLIVCLGAVGIGALSMIISVLYAFIGYYNFKIIKSENGLEISYGLLSRHTNTFKFDKICGVKITQSLTQRILGFATIRLEVIGFLEKGSNNDEITSGMLVPLCAMSEVNSILEKILPNFTVDEKTYSAPKLAPFYMWKFLIVSLSFLVPLAILWAINVFSMKINLIITVSLLMALLFTLLIIFADAIMNKKTSGITVKPDKVTTYSGGLYKKIYVIKKQAITAIEQKTTPLRYKNNIVSFTVHFRSNSHANEATAPNLDKTNYKVVENLLTF